MIMGYHVMHEDSRPCYDENKGLEFDSFSQRPKIFAKIILID